MENKRTLNVALRLQITLSLIIVTLRLNKNLVSQPQLSISRLFGCEFSIPLAYTTDHFLPFQKAETEWHDRYQPTSINLFRFKMAAAIISIENL